ncbi:hypothetical protein D3C77_409610 [compost metagenome]
MFTGPQLATQQQAVVAGHHDVEDDQVDHVGFQKGAHLPAVSDDAGAQPVLFQVVAYQFSDFAIVVDDQHMIDMIHARLLFKRFGLKCTEPGGACLPGFVLQCICCAGRYLKRQSGVIQTHRRYLGRLK